MSGSKHNFCRECGLSISSSAKFCGNCGSKFSEGPDDATLPDPDNVDSTQGSSPLPTSSFTFGNGLAWSSIVFAFGIFIQILGASIGKHLGPIDYFSNTLAYSVATAIVSLIVVWVVSPTKAPTTPWFVGLGSIVWAGVSSLALLVATAIAVQDGITNTSKAQDELAAQQSAIVVADLQVCADLTEVANWSNNFQRNLQPNLSNLSADELGTWDKYLAGLFEGSQNALGLARSPALKSELNDLTELLRTAIFKHFINGNMESFINVFETSKEAWIAVFDACDDLAASQSN